MQRVIDDVAAHFADAPQFAATFARCYPNTFQTTLKPMPDGTTFVITGDIPAMWLRDSAAQVRPYLIGAADDPQLSDLVAGVSRRQFAFILLNPYANAFNAAPDGSGHRDETLIGPQIWECKYEIDSLCYPIQLAYLLWRATGRVDHLDEQFSAGCRAILKLWRVEQRHADSPYFFRRTHCPPTDTLSHAGLGAPVGHTGMTWSGFRPSDDACTYGYLVPANMFAVVVLGYLAEIADAVLADHELAHDALALRQEIDAGIKRHAIVQHPEFGPIYAYEVDGLGSVNLMDDANVPSLLAIAYLGYCAPDDPIYLNTRRFILSQRNPFYFSGAAASGVGSPHTPSRYIWHIALAVQGLTSTDAAERLALLKLMAATDGGTGVMHEGFDVDDPTQFTREWFAWANAMYAELALMVCGHVVPGSPLAAQLLGE